MNSARTDGSCSCSKGAACKSSGKHPRLNDWVDEATDDLDVINGWFRQWPDANLGVATGEASGFFVLDVDPDKGGADSLAALIAEHGPLPLTTHAITGSGGAHYLFNLPAYPLSNSASRIGRGLDTRANGGQIVVAPSRSAKGQYRWVRPPWETPPADAPAWLLAALSRGPSAPAPSEEARGYFPPASAAVLEQAREALERHGPGPARVNGEGGGQHTVQACSILSHDFALDDDECMGLLREWNETRTPPWSEDELRERLERGRRYGKAAYGCRRSMDALAQVRKLIADWQANGSDDPMALVVAARKVPTDDNAVRSLIARELRAATGIGLRELDLPPAVDREEAAARAERQRAYEDGSDAALIDPSAPLDVARRFLASGADAEGMPALRRWQGAFFKAQGSHYAPCTDEAVRADLYRFTDGKRNLVTNAPVKPDRQLVETVAHAATAAAALDARTAPAWIRKVDGDHEPAEIVAFPNGLLHVPTRTFRPPTRRLFNLNALSFDYEASAPAPSAWLAFLAQVWPDDSESVETLQEFMGLALTGDTSFQKIFLMVGPKRSGKGTIARVLQSLVGEANHSAPTLSGLGQQFGLEPLIGKTLAVISDARLGGRADLGTVTENLLRVSGEDTISVPRKHREDWNVKLSTRFLILSNEVPALLDQSGALASRFVVLRMTASFFGQEDRGLTARLLAELPSILLWSLAGLDRLRARGYFRQPASGQEMFRQLETLGSPVKAFVEECCEVKPGATVACADLFTAWCLHASSQGREHPGTAQMFGRNLSAAFPGIGTTRPRAADGSQVRQYAGIRLKAP
ncbi:phage/plasmid primase, P4 family [Pyxidicoccus sp. QH1ED-7-1]|nr:phage/plasmid primase, P4 family [Pyxidicoccus xibeiensis]